MKRVSLTDHIFSMLRKNSVEIICSQSPIPSCKWMYDVPVLFCCLCCCFLLVLCFFVLVLLLFSSVKSTGNKY